MIMTHIKVSIKNEDLYNFCMLSLYTCTNTRLLVHNLENLFRLFEFCFKI